MANKPVDRFAGSANTVLFPLYPPSQTDEVFDVVTEIRLCHSASFIADRSMDYNTIADVVILLSTYVFFVKKNTWITKTTCSCQCQLIL